MATLSDRISALCAYLILLTFCSKLYGDIVILEDVVKDNIDEGKSIEYFKWLANNLPDPKPKFGKPLAFPLNMSFG